MLPRQIRRPFHLPVGDGAEQLDVLTKIVDTLSSEFAAGRDMINRVLRVLADGVHEFFDLPKQ